MRILKDFSLNLSGEKPFPSLMVSPMDLFFFFLFGPSKNIIVYCNRTMSLLIEEEEEEPNNACTLNLQIKHLDFRGALNDIY